MARRRSTPRRPFEFTPEVAAKLAKLNGLSFKTFAAQFASETLGRAERGWGPSAKQLALIEKLYAERFELPPAPPPPVPASERDALDLVTVDARAWRLLAVLVAHEAFMWIPIIGMHNLTLDDLELVRSTARRILADLTGYDKIVSVAEYSDAMKAVTGNEPAYKALGALLELHVHETKEGKIAS